MKEKHLWFLGFTAVFAALATFVFWGTWSLDFAFVAPDAPMMHSPDWLSDWWRNWRSGSRDAPSGLSRSGGSR